VGTPDSNGRTETEIPSSKEVKAAEYFLFHPFFFSPILQILWIVRMADMAVDKADLDPVEGFTHHAEDITADREPYGPPGLRGLISNPFVLMCAACSTLGGLVFGYDQGVVSVILVMDQFLEEFPRVGGSGAGFWKGLLTAMIELGALLGALNQGWIADKISRRYSIVVAVVIFTIGSILQTAAFGYPMLVVARLIGGLGIGMLSMVAPLYISEISKFCHTPSTPRYGD
jgi:hypothetical protein